jgi:ribosomal protein S18 acetylase RimI-like enzyme
MKTAIRPFVEQDSEALVSLWQACDLTRPWNDPRRDIQRKLSLDDGCFWVVEDDARTIVGSVMFGYDGHRGNVYYLCVDPNAQGLGIGTILMNEIETFLREIGCPKINIMVRTTNLPVIDFYQSAGYSKDEVICLGKRLIPD